MPGSEPSRRPTACTMGKPAELHLRFPPHSRSRHRREGRVHSPLQPAARPPTTILLPAIQPADLPAFLPIHARPDSLDAILLCFIFGTRTR